MRTTRMYKASGPLAEIDRIVEACAKAGYLVTRREADEAWSRYSSDKFYRGWLSLDVERDVWDDAANDFVSRKFTDADIVETMKEFA